MIVLFFVLVTVMILGGVLCVMLPLINQGKTSYATQDDHNIAIYRQGLAELEDDRSSNNLSNEQFQRAKQELDQRLLQDVHVDQTEALETTRPLIGPWSIIIPLFTVPLLSGLLYYYLGPENLLAHLEAASQTTSTGSTSQAKAPSLQEMIDKLSAHLQNDPGDAKGWRMLGRTNLALNRYDQAATAFAKAHALLGNQPDLLANYAQSLVLANKGTFNPQVKQLIDTTLKLQPDHPNGLWLAGMAAYQDKRFQSAIEFWQRLLAKMPADDEQTKFIKNYISLAHAGLGKKIDTLDADVITTKAVIKVHVSVASALLSKVTPNDRVFIFARAVQGPPMPLAAVRKQVKDLPTTIQLDDTMAMTPGITLSSAKQVVIVARISKSGTPTAQSGDLQSSPLTVEVRNQKSVVITIDQEIP